MDSVLLCLLLAICIHCVLIYKLDAVCSPGFYGPSCHKENIALNRETTQSSTFNSLNSDLAVDGNTDKNLTAGSCTHTDNDSQSSWSVLLDPQKEHNITNVTLYLRDKLASRYKDLHVTVDSVLCGRGNITNTNDTQVATAPTPNPVLLRCHKPLRGHRVSVHVNNSYLTLCEVQIWGCEDGWFGDDCSESCRCSSASEVCDKLTGYCRSGCSSGWEGRGCQFACSNKTYGPGCSLACGQCLEYSPCDPVTGLCSKGCDPGWGTLKCDRPCRNNTYGPDCSLTCGHCWNSSSCDPVTGYCSSGCDLGWESQKCDQVCKDGYFGDDCSKTCRCKDINEVCDKLTGYCTSGCDTGFEGWGCQTDSLAIVPFLAWAIVATTLALILMLAGLIIHLRRHQLCQNTSKPKDCPGDVNMIENTDGNSYGDLQERGQDSTYQELDLK